MKTQIKIFTIILISITKLFYAQGLTNDIKVSKKSIEKIFKNSIYQPKKIITIPSNPWYSINSEYHLDTIKLINSNKGINPNICEVKNWTFYKKNSLVITNGSYCKEPPTESSTRQTDYFEMKIFDQNAQTYIELYNQKQLRKKFIILGIQQYFSLSYTNEKRYTITLKRINSTPADNMGFARCGVEGNFRNILENTRKKLFHFLVFS